MGAIGRGICVLLGISRVDTASEAEWMYVAVLIHVAMLLLYEMSFQPQGAVTPICTIVTAVSAVKILTVNF